MEGRTDLSSRGPALTSVPVKGDGPVHPTSTAISPLRPLGLSEVALSGDCDLGAWQRRNSDKTLPHCVEQVLASGALRNLQRVADGQGGVGRHEGMHFSDSDLYKTLEAAAWDGVRGISDGVEQFTEEVSVTLARAQRDDGYLNSWFQGEHPELIWKDLRWGHELYCAGHLLQAVVAFERTAGRPELLTVANRLVEQLLGTFSLEDGDGRLVGLCGHPEVETALVEFYRVTGDTRALDLAKRYIDLRGRPDVALPATGLLGGRPFPLSYFLHHMPVRDRTSATGHAVRELYLQAGVVDVAVETQDEQLLAASEVIWDDLFGSKTYITGGHGSRHRDEAIGDAYELPSDRAYAETCAAIASFQWNWRLLLATGRPRYADAMEQAFWNTIAGAVSRQGTEFFYSNSLHLRTGHDGADEDSPRRRLPWYQCACCPPNLARLLASMQTYLLTRDGSGLQMHMPFSGTVSTSVPGGEVELTVRTGHPWVGSTGIEVVRSNSPQPWDLSLRLPHGSNNGGTRVTLNDEPLDPARDGSYVRVTKHWRAGDRLEMYNEVPIRVLRPHWRADAVRGSVAVQRGPLVYCLDAEDLEEGTDVEDVVVDGTAPFEPADEVPNGLDGYVQVVINAQGRRVVDRVRRLYEDESSGAPGTEPLRLTLVPYFARGNRPSAAMRVWVPDVEGDGEVRANSHQGNV
jgi:uncharacterized protein